jgi:hypothetical protein
MYPKNRQQRSASITCTTWGLSRESTVKPAAAASNTTTLACLYTWSMHFMSCFGCIHLPWLISWVRLGLG